MASTIKVDFGAIMKKRRESREGDEIKDLILTQAQKRKKEQQTSAGIEPIGLSDNTVELLNKIKGTKSEIISMSKDLGLDFGAKKVSPTAAQIQSFAEKHPGATASGTTVGNIDFSQKVTNIGQRIDEKIADGTVAERFQIRKEEREPEQKAKVKRAEAEVARDARLQQQFDDIQVDLLSKGTELNTEQKAKLVSAKQGQEDINIARELLGDELTVREIFSSGTGALAKIASFDQPQARKLQTAVNSAIINFVFAKSGAQVSDKERLAMQSIFGPAIGGNIDTVNFKLDRLDRFFELTGDIFDPNKVAGLSAAEKSARIKEIKNEMLSVGANKDDVETAMQAVKRISDDAVKAPSSENKIGRFTVEVI